MASISNSMIVTGDEPDVGYAPPAASGRGEEHDGAHAETRGEHAAQTGKQSFRTYL